MKKVLLFAAMAALTVVLVSACGIRPSSVIHGAPAPTERLDDVVLFFLNDKALVRVTRPPTEPPIDNLALLGEGPTHPERRGGLTTEIPAAAAPITMSTTDRQTAVRISSPVADLTAAARDQIACTAAPPWQMPRVQVVITGTDQAVPVRACPYNA